MVWLTGGSTFTGRGGQAYTNGTNYDFPPENVNLAFANAWTLLNQAVQPALSGFPQGSRTGITAGTTRTQAGATLLTGAFNRVDTSTAPAAGSTLGDGVILPSSAAASNASQILVVQNNSANIIQVYAQGTDTINGVAGSTGVALAINAIEFFVSVGAGAWAYDSGVGTSGQLATMLAVDNVSAAGTTQAAATLLTADFSRVTTATAGSAVGVKLPVAAAGLDVFILNHSGTPITVFGNGADTIDDVAGPTGVVQMNGSVCLYTAYGTGKWYTEGLATGYAGSNLQTFSSVDNLTAHAGGGQGAATPLTAMQNRVTTVATAGDSVILPTSVTGMQITLINAAAANALNLFPATGDQINTLGVNAAFSLVAGKTLECFCVTAGQWHTVLSA